MIIVREKVRFVETDLMGVVHHSNYFRWFEIARVEYLSQTGVELLDLMADGILFPITDVSCRYLAPAKFGDEVLIEVEMKEASKAKMVFIYKVFRQSDGTLLASAQTQNVFTGPNGNIIRLPAKYYNKLKAGCLKKIQTTPPGESS